MRAKSCAPNGGDCVEIAALSHGRVGIRDSKNLTGPALIFAPAAWSTFHKSLAADDFGLTRRPQRAGTATSLPVPHACADGPR
ncbi:DUF397 domain-containing protein [Sphaerisporangium aureirubrum]|uniref:DUF397 domain-containing protein n=1 Tax=Sphaerisporangium aureirubrum TaxID=1544736 RepID=A0ABW1NBP0_9ACTN